MASNKPESLFDTKRFGIVYFEMKASRYLVHLIRHVNSLMGEYEIFSYSHVSFSQMFGNWTFGTLVFTVMVITVTLKVSANLNATRMLFK